MHLFFDNIGYGAFCAKQLADTDPSAAWEIARATDGTDYAHHHISYNGPIKRWKRDCRPVPGSLATGDCAHWTGGRRQCRRLVSHHVDLWGFLDDALVYVERQFYCRDHVDAVTLCVTGHELNEMWQETDPVTISVELDADLMPNLAAMGLTRHERAGVVISRLVRAGLEQQGRPHDAGTVGGDK